MGRSITMTLTIKNIHTNKRNCSINSDAYKQAPIIYIYEQKAD